MSARDVLAASLWLIDREIAGAPLPHPSWGTFRENDPETAMIYETQAVCIHSALAAAGLVVEKGWQPIETAPRDGTEILVWAPDYHGRPVRASWCVNVGAWESDVGMMEDGPGIMADECAGPTHWRHLPAAPQETPDV